MRGGETVAINRDHDADEQAGPPTARQLLRSALVDDEDPRFPWWLPVPGAAIAIVWAAYQATTGGAFFEQLLWPGAAMFILGTLVTFFGWQLDID